MKITRAMSFPNPVLSPYTGDFVDENVTFHCDPVETISDGSVEIALSLDVNSPCISEQLQLGNVEAFLNIVCRDTYFNSMRPFPMNGGPIHVPGGALRGRTVIRAILAVVKPISSFRSPSFHEEYGELAFTLDKGTVIGLTDDVVVNVGLDKLSSMESIFRLSKDPSIPDGSIGVDLDGPSIEIKASPSLYDAVNELRNSRASRSIVECSIYFPAVMQVLNVLSADSQSYEGKRWYRVFSAKCDYLRIDLARPDILMDTQRLMNAPLNKLLAYKEAFDVS